MKLKVLLPYLILVIFLVLIVYFIPRIIIIKSITCQSQYGPCSDSINYAFDKAEGGNYILSKKTVTEILKNDLGVDQYNIQLQFPANFKVNVIERKSVFGLKKKSNDLIFLVDSDGKVLTSQDQTNLPLLYVNNISFNVGDIVDEKVLFALKMLYDMHQYFDVKEGVLEDYDLLIKIGDGPSVILPLEGDRKVLIGSLRLIIAKLEGNDENFSIEKARDKVIIDLRFKNPVIR